MRHEIVNNAGGTHPIIRAINMLSSSSESRRAPALAALRALLPRVTPVPPPFPSQRETGSRARGLSYERQVGKELQKICANNGWTLWDHQWFLYECGTERKYFQPDFVIEQAGGQGIVAEVKLTHVDATAQLKRYISYLKVFGLDCIPLTIVRHLTPLTQTELIIDDFNKSYANAVWHLYI